MKKCKIVVSSEYLKEKLNLEKEAVIVCMDYNPKYDTYEIYIQNSGIEKKEAEYIG